eukprot:2757278-Rhodomonas_salina.2
MPGTGVAFDAMQYLVLLLRMLLCVRCTMPGTDSVYRATQFWEQDINWWDRINHVGCDLRYLPTRPVCDARY